METLGGIHAKLQRSLPVGSEGVPTALAAGTRRHPELQD